MSSSPATSAPIPFTPIFFCLTLSTAYLVYRTRYSSPVPQPGDSSKPSHSPSTDPRFRSFQKLYLTVYSLVMLGDWLQGPYVYALYDAYGYSQHDNAVLFVVGFGSSMVFGTFIGSLSDKLGRKNGCLVYVACYVGSCLTKHFNSFPVLSLGRLLGGVSTSLLFSVFDSWMINEHNARGFREELLGDTFGLAIFCNSCIAILAGLLANAAASAGEMREAVGEGMGGGPTKGDGKVSWGWLEGVRADFTDFFGQFWERFRALFHLCGAFHLVPFHLVPSSFLLHFTHPNKTLLRRCTWEDTVPPLILR